MLSSSTNPDDTTPRICTRNFSYLKTLVGLLKIAEFVLCLTSYVCAATSPRWRMSSLAGMYFFEFVVLWHMWSVFIILILILLNVHYGFRCIHWQLMEVIHYFLATVLVFIGSVYVGVKSTGGYTTAASILGILASVLFAISLYLAFKFWRKLPYSRPTPV